MNIKLKGLSVLYYPVVWLYKVLFSVITPRFWAGIVNIAEGPMPLALKIIIIFFVSIIILCFYLAIFGVFMAVIISLTILISIVYGLAAVINVIGGWWKYYTLVLNNTSSFKYLLLYS